MNGHASSKRSSSPEEGFSLLTEKAHPRVDIDGGLGRSRFGSDLSSHGRAWASQAGAYASAVSCAPWRNLILRIGIFLLPSFVQSRLPTRDLGLRTGPDRLGPTSYLDGMRGLAALFVFFCHYFYACFRVAEGWGFGEENYYILKLPFIRLFYQGPPMVCVFFIISGYALSLRPLKLMRARAHDRLAGTMSSFVFRRAFRLFLPTAASTLLVVFMLRIGLYEWTRDFANDPTYLRNMREIHYHRFKTNSGQLTDWGWNMFRFFHIWSWQQYGGSTAYDVHLWTIPVEFRASMMLFLTLIGTSGLKTGFRFFFLFAAMAFSYRSDRWEMVLFFTGMFLAEYDLIRGAHSGVASNSLPVSEPVSLLGQPQPPLSPGSAPRSRRLRSIVWAALSIFALYLMSAPDVGYEWTPGWVYLSSLIPKWVYDKYRYWQCAGSILFVFAVGHSPSWQRFFNNPIAQYCGKISYAIYLMHGPVLHTVGYATERWAWRITGIETDAQYVHGFVLGSIFVVPMVVWAADVWWRLVDAPTVRFSKWLETKCSVSG